MNIKKPIIVLDIDGTLTENKKIWGEQLASVDTEFGPENKQVLFVSKLFSDQDSYLLEKLSNHIILITGDKKINKKWANVKGLANRFIYSGTEDKYNLFQKFWKENIGDTEIDYVYCGDTLGDYTMLINARIAYTPRDCSKLLRKKMIEQKDNKYVLLYSAGGNGILDEIVMDLIKRGELNESDIYP